jgi:hypothetical protein
VGPAKQEGKPMMFEYVRLLGFGGESPFTLENIAQVLIFAGCIFVLFFGGYMIKGGWGAIIALSAGALVYLYVKGLLPF